MYCARCYSTYDIIDTGRVECGVCAFAIRVGSSDLRTYMYSYWYYIRHM